MLNSTPIQIESANRSLKGASNPLTDTEK